MFRLILILLPFLTLFSCSDSTHYTSMEMFMMAFTFDSTIEEVRVTDPINSIRCHSYPVGCIKNSPKRFKIRLVEMVVVQFMKASQACEAAKIHDQFYTRNWLLDDVKGEPVLESFVKEVYGASNPSKDFKCVN